MLERLQEMVDDLTSTNSSNEKLERLADYGDLKEIIKYAHNPMMQFYVTSKTIDKYPEGSSDWANMKDDDIFILLNNLNSRQLSGHAALAAVNGFVTGHPEYKDLIYSIIDKNLKIRMSDTQINKVFPGLIPEFKVQLADKFNIDKPPKFEKEVWFASRKLDGVRCLAVCKGGDINFYSRTGKEFLTLDVVKETMLKELPWVTNVDCVFDGEMCIVDEKGNEDFTAMMKVIRKKGLTIPNPRYKIFDMLSLKEFDNKAGVELFSKRYENYINLVKPSTVLSPVEQLYVDSVETFNLMSAQATELGWEGLIIRKDVPYAGKRSKNMLKVKEFHDAEYEVIGTTQGPVRFISKETGLEDEEIMMGAATIVHKGTKVGVGSGWSIQQRRDFHKDPNLIVGKTITVKYFEESQDKDGNYSLRFPIVKVIHGDKREV